MKKTLAIFMLLLMMLQIMKATILVENYYYNQDFFAKEMCVKKEIKNNDCKGKCHLKKQLQDIDENKSNAPKKEKETEVYFIMSSCKISQFIFFAKADKNKRVINLNAQEVYLTSFRPPTNS